MMGDLREHILFVEEQKHINKNVAAIFDVDGTLINELTGLRIVIGNTRKHSFLRYLLLVFVLPVFLFLLIVVDFFSRVLSQKMLVFVSFAHLPVATSNDFLKSWMVTKMKDFVLVETHKRLLYHLKEGHTVILLSGSPRELIAPLAGYFGAHVAISTIIGYKDHNEVQYFTGHIDNVPMVGQHKLKCLLHVADQLGLNLQESYAYGDHFTDCDVLNSVGHPVAVRPDRRLKTWAQKMQWEILNSNEQGIHQ